MRRYIEHIKGKTPHERRQHAMQIAGAVTFLLVLGWLATLGIQNGQTPTTPGTTDSNSQTQLANVASSIPPADTSSGAGIEVATTSVFDTQQQ